MVRRGLAIPVLLAGTLAAAMALAIAASLSAQAAPARATPAAAGGSTGRDANARSPRARDPNARPAASTASAPAPRRVSAGPGFRHPDDFRPPPPPPEPPGVRAYFSDIHDLYDQDFGPAAIAMVGARNGTFNGKVCVASGEAVKGLKAVASDLKSKDGAAIPASRIQVRYAVAWVKGTSPGGQGRNILLEAPPAEVGVTSGRALVPVWLSVSVPKDAKVGEYAGQLAIEAAGRKVADVPVKLAVRDWTVPDVQDWRTWIEMVESPETLAIEYELPLWSDKHFALISRAFRLIGQSGSRMVYVPMVCHTNLGNAETMVRWIKKGQTYEPDYSLMDKYLDAAQKEMGQPKIVCFWAWDSWMNPPAEKYTTINENDSAYMKEEKAKLAARGELGAKGVAVTAFDPSTGKSEMVFLPKYASPEGKALWAPVWKTLRQKMKQRGL